MGNWFSNGAAATSIPINDRGLQYGDGLFETVAIRSGEPRLWSLHRERLARGCDALSIRMPDERVLADGIEHAIGASNVSAAYSIVKIIVTAGVSQRGYGRSANAKPMLLFGAFASKPLPSTHYDDGIAIKFCKTRLARNSPVAGLKTLNRIEQVLARSELTSSEYFEGLTMDADGHIICGTMSNVFLVNGQSISTPSLDDCGVAGVMRSHIIASLEEAGMNVDRISVTQSDLEKADEVFISNSQFGVIPVASCDSTHWGAGQVTRDVMATMAESGIVECRL
jgi:4-amino-4-deoxychorismate lyase